MKTTLFGLVLLLGLAPCAWTQAVLRPGDAIELRLSGVPADESAGFNGIYTVDDVGMINLPYINQVQAGGLAANQVQTAVENKLKSEGIYTHPTITVNPPVGARFVSVGGAVRAPGRVPFTTDLTVLSTINAAGGPSDFASDKIRVIRKGKAEFLSRKVLTRDPSKDPAILPGDQIEVLQSWF